MRFALSLLLALAAGAATAQQQEIHRAVVQRDQMTAEFAAQLRGASAGPLESLHARQLAEATMPLSADPALAQAFLPYQRARMQEERAVLRFAPPVVRERESAPGLLKALPLPGGPGSRVDAVAGDGLRR